MLNELMAFALAAYIFLGSVSLGYLFLRTGWRNLDKLEPESRIGSSMIFGFLFSIIAIIIALLVLGINVMGLLGVLFGLFAIVMLALAAKKMLFRSNSDESAFVPKNVAGAKIVAETAEDLFNLKTGKIEYEGWGEKEVEKESEKIIESGSTWKSEAETGKQEKTEYAAPEKTEKENVNEAPKAYAEKLENANESDAEEPEEKKEPEKKPVPDDGKLEGEELSITYDTPKNMPEEEKQKKKKSDIFEDDELEQLKKIMEEDEGQKQEGEEDA